MYFELKLSFDLFSSTATQTIIPSAPSTFDNCFRCLVILILLACFVQLHLIWRTLQPSPNAPADGTTPVDSAQSLSVSRGSKAATSQSHTPPSVQAQETPTASNEEAPLAQRPIKDRVPIAQAPVPPEQTETQVNDVYLDNERLVRDRKHTGVIGQKWRTKRHLLYERTGSRQGLRGSSQLVVDRPPEPADLVLPGTHQHVDPIPEKPACSSLPPAHPIIEGTSITKQNVGTTSHDPLPPISAQTQDSEAENSKNSPLKRTLVGHDLASDVPFVVLGVGVGDERLPGPRHDIELIAKHLPKNLFQALIDTDATQAAIHREIQGIFERVLPSTSVILYFTGHGNDRNALTLSNGQSVGVDILLEWIDQTRKDTGKCLPVFLVFDHCRETHDLPLDMSAAKLEQVYIIWACLPRQQAYEVGLEENLPYSEFLKIICLTLKELLMNKPQSPSYFLERAVHWMSVAVRVHRGFICERAKCPDPWLTCLCVTCYAGGLCEHSTHSPDDKRPIQTPAGWFSESKLYSRPRDKHARTIGAIKWLDQVQCDEE
ncbi:hypothetical protein FRC09_000860 [Ceratobasidium sp. 395]|nr:hypothetical protein FRC09_000860 [Ceratobasidium sp. 395]